MEKPELTELERLRMENIALKYNAAEQQRQSLLQERNRIIKMIEAAHPGCVWRDPEGLITAPPQEDKPE